MAKINKKNYNSEQKQNFQNKLVRKRKSVTYLNEESSLTAFWYLLSMCMCEQFFRTTELLVCLGIWSAKTNLSIDGIKLRIL